MTPPAAPIAAARPRHAVISWPRLIPSARKVPYPVASRKLSRASSWPTMSTPMTPTSPASSHSATACGRIERSVFTDWAGGSVASTNLPPGSCSVPAAPRASPGCRGGTAALPGRIRPAPGAGGRRRECPRRYRCHSTAAAGTRLARRRCRRYGTRKAPAGQPRLSASRSGPPARRWNRWARVNETLTSPGRAGSARRPERIFLFQKLPGIAEPVRSAPVAAVTTPPLRRRDTPTLRANGNRCSVFTEATIGCEAFGQHRLRRSMRYRPDHWSTT